MPSLLMSHFSAPLLSVSLFARATLLRRGSTSLALPDNSLDLWCALARMFSARLSIDTATMATTTATAATRRP
jgi:hypothetical protein